MQESEAGMGFGGWDRWGGVAKSGRLGWFRSAGFPAVGWLPSGGGESAAVSSVLSCLSWDPRL